MSKIGNQGKSTGNGYYDLIASVIRLAIDEAFSTDRKLRADAREWLDIAYPRWRELQRKYGTKRA